MKVGNIVARLAEGQKLSRDEINELRLQLNKAQSAAEAVSGWLGSSGSPDFKYFYADQADFKNPPLESGRWRVTPSQEIPNNTWTDVEFSEETWNTGFVTWDSSGKINFTHKGAPTDRALWMFGFAQFDDADQVGDRGIRFQRAPSGTQPLTMIPASSSYYPTVPFMYPYRMSSTATGFHFEVFQDSGSAVNLTSFWLGILRVL